MSLSPIPEWAHGVTPHLVVENAAEAIAYYARAIGTRELYRSVMPNGRVMLAELLLFEARLFVADEFPEQGARSPKHAGGTSVFLHLYVQDVDETVERAVTAGMRVRMALADYFWGDRYAQLEDPFGHVWGLASRIEDVTPDEIQRRAHAFFGRSRA